jgi:type I restriction enzyme R subunit
MVETPEQRARRGSDADLTAAGWIVQDKDDLDLTAGRRIVVREFAMKLAYSFADYSFHLDRKAVGAVEVRPTSDFPT